MRCWPATIKLVATVRPLFSRPLSRSLLLSTISPKSLFCRLFPFSCAVACHARSPPALQSKPWWPIPKEPIDAVLCCLFAQPQVTCNHSCPLRASRLTRLFWPHRHCQYSPTRRLTLLWTTSEPWSDLPKRELVTTHPHSTDCTPWSYPPPAYLEAAVCGPSHFCQLLVKADTAHYTYLSIPSLPRPAVHPNHKRSTGR